MPTATPTLLAEGELNEVRLERERKILWRRRASSTEAIAGPILWPLEPLQGGERMQLVLRPRGASGGDAVTLELQAASAVTLRQQAERIRSFGADPQRWRQAIAEAADRDPAQAMALLTSPQAPAELAVTTSQLRCSDASQARRS